MIDPHTANAVVGAAKFRDKEIPMVAYETAQPFKFSGTMRFVLGRDVEVPVPERFKRFTKLGPAALKRAANLNDIQSYLDGIGFRRKTENV